MNNDCGTKLEIRAKRKKANKKAHEKVTLEESKSTPQDTRVLRSWGVLGGGRCEGDVVPTAQYLEEWLKAYEQKDRETENPT